MNSFIFILVLILIPVFIATIFIPYWTRRTDSFGVTIPAEIFYRTDIKGMRKRYAVSTSILSLLLTVIFLISITFLPNNENSISILFSAILTFYIISSFLVYVKYHTDMKRIKEKENWINENSQLVFVDIRFRDQKLTYSNLWFLFSFLITIVTIILTLQSHQQIPDRIPMQYNFAGEVTNWAEKSYRSVLLNPVMQMYLTILFLFINKMIARAKQQIDPENPEESIRKNVLFRRRWSAYIIITGLALTVMFTIIQLSFIYHINQQVLTFIPLIVTLGLIIGSIILSITTGQGGSRVKSISEKNGNVINRDDDKYWKLGQFYFNKEDPALFLEKRFGVGWTINLARPMAWIIFFGIIGFAFAIPFLLGA
ncbi:DUF1648 domain-containing protein [Oceanobacillus longus]|uniref:DUF1648 domain-containing protein n=1 Tax=Oceanobacillus longus TaxID=930120 RepID=A0ABV8H4D6_9BACI